MVEMSKAPPGDIHDFQVVDVALTDDHAVDGIALLLTDARGGRVRLHLNEDMAEMLRERIATALDRRTGP